MRKYLPYILIIISLILILLNIIEKESFQQYISSFFLIVAMIIIIYENKKMNKARIIGILITILGFYSMYKVDQYESGFLLGVFTGILTGVGFGITAIGKFKFWNKI